MSENVEFSGGPNSQGPLGDYINTLKKFLTAPKRYLNLTIGAFSTKEHKESNLKPSVQIGP